MNNFLIILFVLFCAKVYGSDSTDYKYSIFVGISVSSVVLNFPQYAISNKNCLTYNLILGDPKSKVINNMISKKSYCIRYHNYGNGSSLILEDSTYNESIVRKGAANNHFLEFSRMVSYGRRYKKIGLTAGYNFGLLLGGRKRTETRFYPSISDSANYNFAIVRNYSKGNILSGVGLTGGLFCGIIFLNDFNASSQIHFFINSKASFIMSQYNFIPNRIEQSETTHFIQPFLNFSYGVRIIFGEIF